MDKFKAFRIYNDDNTVAGRTVEVGLDDLGPGEVVFKTAYSSVNYKDALAATGTGGKIIRKYPLTGGIDAAGSRGLVVGYTLQGGRRNHLHELRHGRRARRRIRSVLPRAGGLGGAAAEGSDPFRGDGAGHRPDIPRALRSSCSS